MQHKRQEEPKRFLECVVDNFLIQLIKEPSRCSALLDLLFVNREGLVHDVAVCGCLGQSHHETLVFPILGETKRTTNRTSALEFRLADSGLFRRLIDKVSLEPVLEGKGVQEGWICFKKELFKYSGAGCPHV